MGLDTETHDQVLPATSARLTPEEREVAAAYVARHARDDADRDLLLAALGLAWTAVSAGLFLWGRNAWRAL